jgi:hypothetical protein
MVGSLLVIVALAAFRARRILARLAIVFACLTLGFALFAAHPFIVSACILAGVRYARKGVATREPEAPKRQAVRA